MINHHKFIFSKKKNKIIGKFDDAYKNFDKLWPEQKNTQSLKLKIVKGYCFDFKKENINLLEIGCGFGYFLNNLKSLKLKSLYGCDVSPFVISKAKKKFGKHINFVAGDFLNISFKKKFQIIFAYGVFQYLLSKRKSFIKKIYEILNKGGIAIVSFPIIKKPIGLNMKMNLFSYLNMFSKYFTVQDYSLLPINKNIKKYSEYSFNLLVVLKKNEKK